MRPKVITETKENGIYYSMENGQLQKKVQHYAADRSGRTEILPPYARNPGVGTYNFASAFAAHRLAKGSPNAAMQKRIRRLTQAKQTSIVSVHSHSNLVLYPDDEEDESTSAAEQYTSSSVTGTNIKGDGKKHSNQVGPTSYSPNDELMRPTIKAPTWSKYKGGRTMNFGEVGEKLDLGPGAYDAKDPSAPGETVAELPVENAGFRSRVGRFEFQKLRKGRAQIARKDRPKS